MLSREALEARRLEAMELYKLGFTGAEVAKRYGVSRTTTSRWVRALRSKGADGLKLRKAKGRPRRHDWPALAEEIRALYEETGKPSYHDFSVILSERLQINYAKDHLGCILHRLGIAQCRNSRSASPVTAAPLRPSDLS